MSISSQYSQSLQTIYTLPLWLQIYIQQETNPYIKGLMRQTTKKLDNSLLLTNLDKKYVINQIRLWRYQTTKNNWLIMDESEKGNKEYNYYHQMLTSGISFLAKNF